ncbi:GIY-YIG nuclease family protein [Wukongibacter baidiensis]
MNGYIYLLSNSCFKDSVYKIGSTEKTPQERVKALNKSTCIPSDFSIEYFAKVKNVRVTEKRIHLLLDEYRVSRKKKFSM